MKSKAYKNGYQYAVENGSEIARDRLEVIYCRIDNIEEDCELKKQCEETAAGIAARLTETGVLKDE